VSLRRRSVGGAPKGGQLGTIWAQSRDDSAATLERMWRRNEPVLDRETLDGIIRMLMRLDDKLDRIIVGLDLEEENGEEEMDS
jgi:hypothetical protein